MITGQLVKHITATPLEMKKRTGNSNVNMCLWMFSKRLYVACVDIWQLCLHKCVPDAIPQIGSESLRKASPDLTLQTKNTNNFTHDGS